jgi:hypothetical protein
VKPSIFVAGTLLGAALVAYTAAQAPAQPARSWNFDSDKVGTAPAGFAFEKSASGKAGRWIVKQESGAPSGKQVLAQTDADSSDDRFLMAVAQAPAARDVVVSVRCKPVAGKVDQACGLVFRYQDAKNYYVTRANALEGNVRLYTVKDGDREQFASWKGKVTAGAWHELKAEATGDHLRVFWDGQKILDEHDDTFKSAGKVGLWTKADSVTYFDDLSVAPSAAPSR